MVRPAELSAGQKNDFQRRRRRMVEVQLRQRGISDQRVLDAMCAIAREEFIPPKYRSAAYDDCALPIDADQTISQPYTVAFMCESLQLQGDEKVLEIGTGSGYAAAILSRLAREVHTVERLPELAAQAGDRLARLRCANAHVHVSDGTLGLPREAPFDAIIVTAGGTALPDPYVEQLTEGGRIVIPLGTQPNAQTMYRFTKSEDKLEREDLGRFAFVPLIGAHGWGD